MELVCQLLPSPISTRLYDTYPETVKVSHDGKDDGDGQTQGRGRRGKTTQKDQKDDCGSQVTSGGAKNGRPENRTCRTRAAKPYGAESRPDERLDQSSSSVQVQNVSEKSQHGREERT